MNDKSQLLISSLTERLKDKHPDWSIVLNDDNISVTNGDIEHIAIKNGISHITKGIIESITLQGSSLTDLINEYTEIILYEMVYKITGKHPFGNDDEHVDIPEISLKMIHKPEDIDNLKCGTVVQLRTIDKNNYVSTDVWTGVGGIISDVTSDSVYITPMKGIVTEISRDLIGTDKKQYVILIYTKRKNKEE